MERIIKIIFVFIVVCLTSAGTFADEGLSLSTLITAQNVKYQDCTKVFNTDNVKLLYLTISAINANRFHIEEIQSKSGYVVFSAVNKRFLATVTNVNTNQGMLKITPVDNNYYFQPGIVSNIYKYIQINIDKNPENINFN